MRRQTMWGIIGLAMSATLGAVLLLRDQKMTSHPSQASPDRLREAGRSTGRPPPAVAKFELSDPVVNREAYNPVRVAPQLADALKRAEPVSITIDSYNDTFEREIISMSRTRQWAAQMELLLTELGADPGIITVTAHGDTDLVVNTPAGIAEPANRRVEIFFAYE